MTVKMTPTLIVVYYKQLKSHSKFKPHAQNIGLRVHIYILISILVGFRDRNRHPFGTKSYAHYLTMRGASGLEKSFCCISVYDTIFCPFSLMVNFYSEYRPAVNYYCALLANGLFC
jgi:hypothetical protein